MSYFYFDRDGNRIDKASWAQRQNDPHYRILREYDNGSVFLRLMWNGRLTKVEKDAWRDTWPLFQIVVGNYDSKGSLVRDPVMDGETYACESDAIKAYEEFLETWTESHRKDDGTFKEIGNDLAPPPPPDPDVPASEIKGVPSGFVAW